MIVIAVFASWWYSISFIEKLLSRSPQIENKQSAPYKSYCLGLYFPLCLFPFGCPLTQVFSKLCLVETPRDSKDPPWEDRPWDPGFCFTWSSSMLIEEKKFFFNLLIWERERNIDLFFLFMHSLDYSGMCPDPASNPQPWPMGPSLRPTELPSQGRKIFKSDTLKPLP